MTHSESGLARAIIFACVARRDVSLGEIHVLSELTPLLPEGDRLVADAIEIGPATAISTSS